MSYLQVHRYDLGLVPLLLRPFLDEPLGEHLTPAAGCGAQVHHPVGSLFILQISVITFEENMGIGWEFDI